MSSRGLGARMKLLRGPETSDIAGTPRDPLKNRL